MSSRFTTELAAFERSRSELLRTHQGRYAAFLGEELICIADTAREALRQAWLRTRSQSILVEPITSKRAVTRLPMLVAAT